MLNLSKVLSTSSYALCGLRNGLNNGNIPVPWIGYNNYAMSAEKKLGLSKPKKPLSAYIRFANQVRPTLVAKNPGLNGVELLKLASKNWHQIDESVKAKFQKEYEVELEAYRIKFEEYKSSLSEEDQEEIKKMRLSLAEAKEKRKIKAESKELGKPKRPMSSYLLFIQNEKDSIKDMPLTEYQSKMVTKWNALSAKDKAVWDQKAKALKDAYFEELTKWEAKMMKMGNIDLVRSKALQAENKNAKSRSL